MKSNEFLRNIQEAPAKKPASNFNINSIESKNLLAAIEAAYRKKSGWSAASNAIVKLTAALKKSSDPLALLQTTLKKVNPSYKAWTGKQKVAPGQFYGMSTPNVPLSPTAAKFLPSTAKQAQIAAAKAKWDERQAELEKLKAEYEKAQAAASKAEQEHKTLDIGLDEQMLKYFTYIEKNCSEYLKDVVKVRQFLFRGQDDASMPAFVSYPRADREPKDSDPDAQELYDKYLKVLGAKALRSNSIFTSADEGQASNYGTVYAIFPKNGFSFTWSTKEDDLVLRSVDDVDPDAESSEDFYYECENVLDNLDIDYLISDYDLDPKIKSSPQYKKFTKAMYSWQDNANDWEPVAKTSKAFVGVATACVELLKAKPALAKVISAHHKNALVKQLKAANEVLSPASAGSDKAKATKMWKKFGIMTTKLDAALKSEHEVCVLGEYIAINWDEYEEQITAYFLSNPATKEKIKAGVKAKAKK